MMSDERPEFLPTRRSLLSRLRELEDHASWQEFYELYHRLIFSFARRKGLSETEAEDVVQETLLAVARTMPTFRYQPDRCSFKSWLRRLSEARIADHYRRRERRGGDRQIPISEEDLMDAASFAADTKPVPPDEVWDSQWREQVLASAMERVKAKANPKHFRIFHALVSQGLPGPEVARMFDTNLAVVYVARHRIAGKVKKEAERLEKELSARGALE